MVCSRTAIKMALVASAAAALALAGCGVGEDELGIRPLPDADLQGDGGAGIDSGQPADGDVDGDTDSDADSDSDSTTSPETDAGSEEGGMDADVDTDSDADADTDSETGSAEDADVDGDADAGDSGLEPDADECLVISEYAEGSGKNKGLELYNCGDEPLSLSGYSVGLYSNDNTTPGIELDLGDALGDPAVIPPHDVLVICPFGASAVPSCGVFSNVASFNGDDRLSVERNDEIIDAFGNPPVRPEGSPWADATFRRTDLSPYVGGAPFDVDLLFTRHALDDFSDFGVPPRPAPPDSGPAADADSDADTDTDTDTDSDADADTDTDTDTDTEGPDGGHSPGEPCLVISEYIEGSSRNKGIEIYNCADGAVDLTGYSVCLVPNDYATCSITFDLSGLLAPADVITICYPSAESLGPCDLRSGAMYFNGDDRLALLRGVDVLDAFGEIASRPAGAPWQDVTLRRFDLRPFDGARPFDASLYYGAFLLDDFSGFGLPPISSP